LIYCNTDVVLHEISLYSTSLPKHAMHFMHSQKRNLPNGQNHR